MPGWHLFKNETVASKYLYASTCLLRLYLTLYHMLGCQTIVVVGDFIYLMIVST